MSKRKQPPSSPGAENTEPAQPVRRPSNLLAILVVASLAVAVLGILMVKDQRQDAVVLSATQGITPAALASQSSPAPVSGPIRNLKPADQLQLALGQNKPALVFMHSTTCKSCTDMMVVVDQVYPEFKDRIALIDVDVYDEANGPLMETLGLRYIPTVVVFNSQGQTAQNVGLMKAVDFRKLLLERALGS